MPERRRELDSVHRLCKPFAPKVYLPLLRAGLARSEMVVKQWVHQIEKGFPLMGAASDGGARPLTPASPTLGCLRGCASLEAWTAAWQD